jgi:hypothetical protein
MAGLYVQLDVNWPDHPKVIAAGLDGAGLHAAALCLAKRLLTDGVLYRAQLCRLGGTDELIDRLLELGLLDPVDNDRVAVHDWLDRNPTRGAIGGRVGASRDDGKRGNHKRWGHPGDYASCARCNPRSSPSAIGGDRPPSRPPIARDRDRDRVNSDPTVAAARARAEENTAKVRAMVAEPAPTPEANVGHVAEVRKAIRRRGSATT